MVDKLKLRKTIKPSKAIKTFPGFALSNLSSVLLRNTKKTRITGDRSYEFPLNKMNFSNQQFELNSRKSGLPINSSYPGTAGESNDVIRCSN